MEKLKYLSEELTKRCSHRDIPKDLIDYAKENDIVIVYGASDDLMEFDGAFRDEDDCYEGGTAWLDKNGLFVSKCDDEDCPYAKAEKEKCKHIDAIWCGANTDWTWTYETDIPHETFEMLDDGEKYCKGIVFYKSSLGV